MREVNDNPENKTDVNENKTESSEQKRQEALEDMDRDLTADCEKQEAVESNMERSAEADLNNEKLFDENPKGKYTYSETELGKSASGQLTLSEGERNQYAQKTVGGEDRHENDDGGHLIATRFGGSGEKENMDAQNSNLNRGGYKSLENQWAHELDEGNKVYVNVETYKSNSSDRPDCYVGYYITEDKEGNRKFESFSYQNEDRETQKSWADTVDEADMDNEYDNPRNYDPEDYESELSDDSI